MPWPEGGGRRPPQILLVDPRERFVFTPLLVDYAVSKVVDLDEFAPRYAELLRFAERERKFVPGTKAADIEHISGRVARVEWRRRIATLVRGGAEEQVPFDTVVIAPGQLARGGLDGFTAQEGSGSVLAFASLEDGDRLRERLGQGSPGRVAVVGSGYVGVELAAALAESGSGTVSLFGSTLLRGSEPQNRARAAERLEALGVVREQGRAVAAEEGRLLWRPDGSEPGAPPQEYACDLVLLTGAAATPCADCAVEPEPVAGKREGPVARLEVDPYLRIAPGVFCIGDAALAGAPATGQAAMQQAEVAAWNAFAQLTGVPRAFWRSYVPSALGEFVVLGSEDAAAVVSPARLAKLLPPSLPPAAAAAAAPALALTGGAGEDLKVDFGGKPAALLRRLSYLYRLPTLGHRAWVAQRWASRAKDEGAALPTA